MKHQEALTVNVMQFISLSFFLFYRRKIVFVFVYPQLYTSDYNQPFLRYLHLYRHHDEPFRPFLESF